MNRKFNISLIIIVCALILEAILWKNVLILSLVFILLAIIKHKLFPIKKELLWYIFMGFGGGLAEIFLVNIGHGWKYTNPQLLGIPIWIPFFWGLIGTTAIVLYEGISKGKTYTK